MTERRIYLDAGIGETRGVVTLDGRPERLLIRRNEDEPRLLLGARLNARVASLEPALATAFLDLGGGLEAILPYKPDAKPVRGQLLEIEIRSEPRRGKLAVARAAGEGQGAVGVISPPPDLEQRLRELVRGGEVTTGAAAREAADAAEAEALEIVHALPGGGDIAIEPTRALTSIDIDLGARTGGDAKRAARQGNLVALKEAARLLRLKGLGGLVVIDLVGRGHDGAALLATARAAFAPDNPGVAIGPVGRFGTMELSLPRRERPVIEVLCEEGWRPSDRTIAQRLIRRIEAEALAQPGSRLTARCAPAIAQAAEHLSQALAARIGGRFTISADPARAREALDVAPE